MEAGKIFPIRHVFSERQNLRMVLKNLNAPKIHPEIERVLKQRSPNRRYLNIYI